MECAADLVEQNMQTTRDEPIDDDDYGGDEEDDEQELDLRRSPCENGSSGGDLSDPPSHVSSTLSKELGGLKDCQDPIQVSAAALATAQAMFAAAGKAADRVPPLGLLPGAHGFLNSPAHLQALRNPAFLQLTQNLGLPDPTDKQYAFDDQLKQSSTEFCRDFKLLYELSDDPKRKEFLDDLFAFMQKRGTPVNRIPIMAKQVLDLYELYRLVVARGGLVEVINKKIWREITKGLNLPSSITSAAFTLRTQYMKYLYPYECDKEKLSHPDELQAAIDGNRREGRRSSYNHFNEMLSSGTAGSGGPVRSPSSNNAPPLSLVPHRGLLQLNGGLNGNNNNLHGASSGEEDNSIGSMIAGAGGGLLSGQEQALNLDVKMERRSPPLPPGLGSLPPSSQPLPSSLKRNLSSSGGANNSGSPLDQLSPSDHLSTAQQIKKLCAEELIKTHIQQQQQLQQSKALGPLLGKDGRPVEAGIPVSMEINGILYQGILFAQTKI
ncbi:AT-rich interactive domain-containing protein 3C-like isoform X6 [Varroa destructor]|uniref:Uncharacterized protein n=1 Tax=Varroa destructor TaxID=109461 RepID=A0A7M7KCB1_VARDE|nr:AT-rich interactive domain-containing protein 3C-like isoform X6 [Varroa destructor]